MCVYVCVYITHLRVDRSVNKLQNDAVYFLCTKATPKRKE